MRKRPEESKTERIARLKEVVEKYKTSVEFLPILGGRVIIPEDIQFLLGHIVELEDEVQLLKDAIDFQHDIIDTLEEKGDK